MDANVASVSIGDGEFSQQAVIFNKDGKAATWQWLLMNNRL